MVLKEGVFVFIKSVGMLLIFASCMLMGCYFAGKKRYRGDDLAAMKRALTLLKNQICFLAMPLPEAMKDIAQKTGGSVGEAFLLAGQMMGGREGNRAESIWQQALEKKKGKLYFNEEDWEMLLSFGKTLGYLDSFQQQDSILIACEYLKEQEAQVRNEWAKHQKLCVSIGALSGLLLIVALL